MKIKRVVMYIKDRDNTIENILNYIKYLTRAGHGFDVEIDPDDKKYHKHFYIDGDGEDKIREIYVDDDKLRTIETDTAYECGKHANKWIPVSERLPEDNQSVLVWCPQYKNIYCAYIRKEHWWIFGVVCQSVPNEVVAWMPLPNEPQESEDKK